MKKNIFLSILIAITFFFLLPSCSCKHEWSDATCTEPQTCSKCGATQGKALGHKYNEEITVLEPTCTTTGIKESECAVCGNKKTEEIPAKGHEWTFVNKEKEATCTETGKSNYKCSVCGEIGYKTISKLPHKYKDGYCTVCFAEDPDGVQFSPSKEEKENIKKIKTMGNNRISTEDDFYYLLFGFSDAEQTTVIAPCVVEIRIVNSKDEIVYKAKKVVKTNDYMKWSNWFTDWTLASPKIMRADIKEGTSNSGTLYFTVKLADGRYFEESSLSIYSLPVHSFDKEEILQAATCGSDGLVRKTCASCGEVVEETIPATGRHTYRKGTIAKEPTCSAEGIMEYACTVCGYVGVTEKIETTEHSFVNDKCTYCGTLRIGSKGPAEGYVFYDCDLDNENGNADGLISSECGWRFLEAAPEDIGKAVFGFYRRSSNGKNLYANGDTKYYEENCTRKGIGYGRSNTEMLVDAMEEEAYVNESGSEKTADYAAKMCADYSLNGYDDWFLPSKDELNLLCTNLQEKGLGNFRNNGYWSSSEDSGNWALVQSFNSGSQYSDSRCDSYCVRPIRSFSEGELCHHVWGSGEVSTPATCVNEGEKTYTCKLCKRTKTERIPAKGHSTYIDYKCTVCGLGSAGGYIFYDCDADNDSGNADGLISTECGWRYLEAAPCDLSESKYGGFGTIGTSTAVGAGKSNTETILKELGSGKYAAKACADYMYNGYADWFLPSKDELKLMYTNLHEKWQGNFKDSYYWSSSESGSDFAWRQYFVNGYQGGYNRSGSSYVRPIRRF